MMRHNIRVNRSAAYLLCFALLAGTGSLNAQQGQPTQEPGDALEIAEESGQASGAADGRVIEEMVTVGKLRSAATDVVQQRIDMDVVADFMGADQISRVGDSTVSLALRRMPGVTLVQGQYVYVRGLGERYSSTLLNGAQVPSPDLTRNVLPLDIFPTDIIESIAIQKGYTPEMPAAFGGGNVNIRTKGIPDGPMLAMEVGTGWNSLNGEEGLTYEGGSDDALGTDDGTRALSPDIQAAFRTYRGDISATSIFNTLLQDGRTHGFDEARAINSDLALALNRDLLAIESKSLSPDLNLEGSAGNRWYFGDDEQWEFGAVALASYKSGWRNRDRENRSVLDPENERSLTRRTINGVAVTGVLNTSLAFTADHQLNTTTMLIRNTEDEVSLTTGNNFNFVRADGRQFRTYDIRFEERELLTNQIRGRHVVGVDTRERIALLDHDLFDQLAFEWYYSLSTARTDIPSEVRVSAEDLVDPASGSLLSTSVRRSGSAADYRYTDLEDQVDNWGGSFTKPFHWAGSDIELSGGWDYVSKGRQYMQYQLGLGTTALDALPVLEGTPAQVFTDANIADPVNGFALSTGGIGTESYLAAQSSDAVFGKFDMMLGETWRLSGGARWEQFQQASLPIDPLEYDANVGQAVIGGEDLVNAVFRDDQVYPSLALTYIRDGFWAEQFQLRFGASQTAARPDLREISQATYIDPLTEARVRGNPNLVPSDLLNLDIRAEWYFDDGDSFTLSAFYKDISDPIETVEGDGTDDNISLTFVNADSASIYGLEIEWLNSLSSLGEWAGAWSEPFFLAGNLTLSESELKVGDSVLDVTNATRPMSQHSDYVANLQFGFDSPGGMHSATLVYNVFGERLYYAGKNGAADAYERPFNSLDLVYSFYPTERLTMKLRLQNLLDEDLEIEQSGVTVLRQDLGATFKVDLKWDF